MLSNFKECPKTGRTCTKKVCSEYRKHHGSPLCKLTEDRLTEITVAFGNHEPIDIDEELRAAVTPLQLSREFTRTEFRDIGYRAIERAFRQLHPDKTTLDELIEFRNAVFG